MKLGVFTDTAELQEARERVFTPDGYVYEPDEPQIKFGIRPWTRTTQELVNKRAKAKNIAIMDADEALKRVGSGDKRAEAYVRELADFLIKWWENVVYGADVPARKAKKGDPMPCTSQNKVFLFEDVTVAVWIVEEAKKMATVQISEEVKNSDSSSGGAPSPATSLSQTSE